MVGLVQRTDVHVTKAQKKSPLNILFEKRMDSTLIRIAANTSLDPATNELIFSNQTGILKHRLEPLSSQLLAYLAQHRGNLLSREQLIEELWEGNEGVGNKALTRNIYKLRKAFEAHGIDNPIETIPKKGYRIEGSAPFQLPKKKRSTTWLVAAGVVVGFIVLKLMVPGMFHMMSHRMMH